MLIVRCKVYFMVIRSVSVREIKNLPKTGYKVLVMRYFPFYIKGLKRIISEWLPILSPSKELLSEYRKELEKFKNGGYKPQKACELAWNIVSYDSRFRRQILRDSEAIKELKRIRDISRELKGRRVVYLICVEATDDYCHRRILQELMEEYEI